MLSTVLLVAGIVAVYGAKRNFTPQIAEGMDHHKLRVWAWLNPKCFATETSVREFKDYLLSEYECIDWNEERKTIYKHPTVNGDVWSLWLELNNFGYHNFKCLDDNITLPAGIMNECISNVYYEPIEHIDQTGSCQNQVTTNNLWSLDEMDGFTNQQYQYFAFESTEVTVEAIVLDTGVEETHVEFSGLTVTNLFTGTPTPTTQYGHGTHVSGTVVGSTCGGAKGTDLNWYPVCQQGGSCAWSDIEGGYEAAISLMQLNPSKKYVINYSVGGSRTSTNEPAYNDWGMRIEQLGSFWATSAGNSGSDACNFAPAFTEYAVTVGAYSEGRIPTTRFTNYGPCVDTWAPGDMVWSANPGNSYGYSSGTSMASPNICALMINLIKSNPSFSLSQLKGELDRASFNLVNVPPNYGSNVKAAYWQSGCVGSA